jgi:hypothetical protein
MVFILKNQTSHFSNVLVLETDSNKLTEFDLKYNLLYFAMIVSVAWAFSEETIQ